MVNKDNIDTQLFVQVTADLKRNFKKKCVELDIDMKDAIADLMKQFIKK